MSNLGMLYCNKEMSNSRFVSRDLQYDSIVHLLVAVALTEDMLVDIDVVVTVPSVEVLSEEDFTSFDTVLVVVTPGLCRITFTARFESVAAGQFSVSRKYGSAARSVQADPGGGDLRTIKNKEHGKADET